MLISSPHNPNFKTWKSLLSSRGAKKEGLCLVSGRKIVPELLVQMPQLCKSLLLPDKNPELLNEAVEDQEDLPSHLKIFELQTQMFSELDEYGTRFPLLIMEWPKIDEWSETLTPEGTEVLAALGEPQNLGALVRSSEAFGVNKIVLLSECAFPYHPKAIRSSAGSVFRIKFVKGPSIQDLTGPVVVLDREGEDIREFKWPKPLRLLLGEEGQGVPKNLKSAIRLNIPMQGQIESLNAVAATSIALFLNSSGGSDFHKLKA